MPLHNENIARIFDEMGDLLEIEGANPFRVRAYHNAARTLRELGEDVADLVARDEDLTKLPGIGKDLAAKIVEILDTGHAGALDTLHQEVPASLEDLLQLPGLGPKRVKALYEQLNITTLPQLEQAARDGHIRRLPGFGVKSEQRLLDALAAHAGGGQRRFLRHSVSELADSLRRHLEQIDGVKDVVVAGSYRRGRDTVGDLDILVCASRNSPVMARFVAHDAVEHVVSHGTSRSTVILHNGLQVDLRVVPRQSLGAALHYFTGSKAHNIAIRRLGQQRGLKINEYGVFSDDERIAGDTEASVFEAVGLPSIVPALREGRGEIEAAAAGRLPDLVSREDLRGDLHLHTDASDGHAGLSEMAEAARQQGLRYLAVTDHSRHLTVAHGLDVKRLREQLAAIDVLNDQLDGITLLKGIEVDILEDGSLDLPVEVLRELDLVVGAVHHKFQLPEQQQTERILRAMEQPYFSILAHPTGRLLLERQPYAVDMARIIEAARQRGCCLELNGQPKRLDLNDLHCRMAKEAGVLVAVSSDAHSVRGFDNLACGIRQARRGWLEKSDVLNTRPLGELRKLLAATMG
jgi:DNA polymerase (family 10)